MSFGSVPVGVLSVCEGKPERVLEIQQYVNEQYECCSNKKFMKVLETIARMNGNEEVISRICMPAIKRQGIII